MNIKNNGIQNNLNDINRNNEGINNASLLNPQKKKGRMCNC